MHHRFGSLIREGKWTEQPARSWNLPWMMTASLAKAISASAASTIALGQELFVGTGFLVQQNLIMTNRHVLRGSAEERRSKLDQSESDDRLWP